ncbi:hypothetical protein KBC04_03615 [Candidatus Babeliales bacterium]|nr:hypothetical protein [Candidatus Babeliales bacterium]MBP9843860.1 hypothetical protein [Candidatus Babeliales bacterium]
MKKLLVLSLVFASGFDLSAMVGPGPHSLRKLVRLGLLRNLCMRTQRCIGSQCWQDGGNEKDITGKNLVYIERMIREGKLESWKIAIDAGTTRDVVEGIRASMLKKAQDLEFSTSEKSELLKAYHEINGAPQ